MRPSYADESQVFEHLLPTEERIWGLPIGSCDRPAFDGDGTFAAGKLDRRTHECVGDTLSSVPDPDEEAWYEPDPFVLGGYSIAQDLASSADSYGVPGSRAAGAPSDRLARH